MQAMIETLTLDEIDALLIALRRKLKKNRKDISSIAHLVDKGGVRAIYRDDTLITIYRKSARRNH